jgi:hypothetical protein
MRERKRERSRKEIYLEATMAVVSKFIFMHHEILSLELLSNYNGGYMHTKSIPLLFM